MSYLCVYSAHFTAYSFTFFFCLRAFSSKIYFSFPPFSVSMLQINFRSIFGSETHFPGSNPIKPFPDMKQAPEVIRLRKLVYPPLLFEPPTLILPPPPQCKTWSRAPKSNIMFQNGTILRKALTYWLRRDLPWIWSNWNTFRPWRPIRAFPGQPRSGSIFLGTLSLRKTAFLFGTMTE